MSVDDPPRDDSTVDAPAAVTLGAGVTTYLLTQAVLLFWWIAFYPGTMSYDTVTYVWQTTTSHWDTQHSVLYNALVWLSLRASGELAPLTLLQTVALAAGLGYAVAGLRRLGVPARWLGGAAVALTLVPFVGTFSVYVSKDVPFAITQVFLLGTVARLLAQRGSPGLRPLWWVLAGELVALGLFRQNGFVLIAVITGLLALTLAGLRRRIVLAGTAAVAVAFLANFALYPLLGLPTPRSELLLGPAYADIAVAYARKPKEFTDSERDLLATVAPLEFWAGSANCYNSDTTVSTAHPEFDFAAANRHREELAALWLTLLKRMPEEVLQARICRGSIAWNPFPAPSAGWTVKVPIAGSGVFFDFPRSRIDASPYRDAIRSAPLSRPAHDVAVFARHVSDTRAFEWLLWRGATWALVGYVAVAVFARRRRDLALLGLAAVIAANQLTVLVNNPGQLVRYMAAPFLLGVLLLPLLFVPRPTGGEPSAVDSQDAGRADGQNRGMPPN